MGVRSYTGHWVPGIGGAADGVTVMAHGDGQPARPLPPRLDLRAHSPAGFNWGYEGSGAAQLALALCADATGDDERTSDLYQRFKRAVVAKLPADGWTLTADTVRDALDQLERERGRDRT